MAKPKILKTKKLELLKKYFEKKPSVILAFLFGSFAKGKEMRESDVDIAVYLKDPKKEDDIWFEVSRIIEEREVQLVCMNEAPANLISNIFKTGIPLVIKDKKLYWELYLKCSSEAEDFSHFLEDFWKIYKRSKSLTEQDRDKILERFHFLKLRVEEVEEFKKLSFKEYQEEIIKRRNIERWAETVLNAIIDIAKIILAVEKKEMPRDYKKALLYFGFFIGLTEKEAEKFSKFADLRNILAHEYLDILYKKIREFIKEFPKFYPKISNFLKKYLKLKL